MRTQLIRTLVAKELYNMDDLASRLFDEVNRGISIPECNYLTDICIDIKAIGKLVLVHVGLDNNICNYDLYINIGYISLENFNEDELVRLITSAYRQISTTGCLSINLAEKIKLYYTNSIIEYEYGYLETTGEAREIR